MSGSPHSSPVSFYEFLYKKDTKSSPKSFLINAVRASFVDVKVDPHRSPDLYQSFKQTQSVKVDSLSTFLFLELLDSLVRSAPNQRGVAAAAAALTSPTRHASSLLLLLLLNFRRFLLTCVRTSVMIERRSFGFVKRAEANS